MMAVGCFDPPILNDNKTPGNTGSINASSSSPSTNLFHSCWSPIPNSINAANNSWHSVYNWVNNTEQASNGSDCAESIRSSSESQSSPKQSQSPLYRCEFPATSVWNSSIDDPFSSPNTTASSLFSPSSQNSSTYSGIQNFHCQDQSQTPRQHQQQQQSLLYENGDREYNLIQELLKLNIEGCSTSEPTFLTSPTPVVPCAAPKPPKIADVKPAIPPMVPTPPYARNSNASDVPSLSPQTNWTSPVTVPTTATPSVPRPIVGQQQGFLRSDRISHDENELDLLSAEFFRQQAIYEHIYNLVLTGKLPFPLPMRMWNPQARPCQRRSAAALELHMRLEECSEQYRQLEKERKKTEAELARHNLGKKISSTNNMPIPRLAQAPSRIDRLIVDFFREHARVVTLLAKMEQLREKPLRRSVHNALQGLRDTVKVLQQCRFNERQAIFQHLRDVRRYNEDRETAALASALAQVNKAVVRARAANWCSLMWTIGADAETEAQIQRIVQADFELAPPEIKQRPI